MTTMNFYSASSDNPVMHRKFVFSEEVQRRRAKLRQLVQDEWRSSSSSKDTKNSKSGYYSGQSSLSSIEFKSYAPLETHNLEDIGENKVEVHFHPDEVVVEYNIEEDYHCSSESLHNDMPSFNPIENIDGLIELDDQSPIEEIATTAEIPLPRSDYSFSDFLKLVDDKMTGAEVHFHPDEVVVQYNIEEDHHCSSESLQKNDMSSFNPTENIGGLIEITTTAEIPPPRSDYSFSDFLKLVDDKISEISEYYGSTTNNSRKTVSPSTSSNQHLTNFENTSSGLNCSADFGNTSSAEVFVSNNNGEITCGEH